MGKWKRMKHGITVLTMMACLVGVWGAMPPEAKASPYLTEDFNGGITGWMTFQGNWSVANGAYVVNGNGSDRPKSLRNLTTLTSSAYAVEADVTVLTAGEAALLVNAKFPENGASNLLGYGIGIDTAADEVWIGRFNDKAAMTKLASAKAVLNPNTAYRIRIELQDGDMKAYVDNVLFLHIYDSMFMNPGMLGFRGGSNNSVAFDNLVVEPLQAVNTQSVLGGSAIVTGNTYKIRSDAAGKLLEVAPDGATVDIYEDLQDTSQQWRIEQDGNGYFFVRSASAEASCLTVSNQPIGQQQLGAYLKLSACGTVNAAPDSQRWSFVPIANGYYKLQSKASGFVATLENGVTSGGTKVQQWDGSTPGPHQGWRFEFVQNQQAAALAAVSGGYKLMPVNDGDGRYGLAIYEQDGKRRPFGQQRPLIIQIRDTGGKLREYKASYSQIASDGQGGWVGSGTVSTDRGSAFTFTDEYSPYDGSGAFRLRRQVSVVAAQAGDEGFGTIFGLYPNESREARNFLNYEYFAPANWYQQNGYNPVTGLADFVETQALASDFSDNYYWIRETRLPLPMFMIRNNTTQSVLSMLHLNATELEDSPEDELDAAAKTTDVFGNTTHWKVGNPYRFGSLGVHKAPQPTLDFVYPGSEGEKTYVQQSGNPNRWSRKSQPVALGASQSYELVLKAQKAPNYGEAMSGAYRYFYDIYNPQTNPLDVDAIYENALETLDSHMQPFGPQNVMGMPFKANVYTGFYDTDGSDGVHDLHMQSGFVGQVLPASYQLLRHGLQSNLPGQYAKGAASIDWWAQNAAMNVSNPNQKNTYGLVRTDYDMLGNGWFPTPIFLRTATDGMEGVIDAYETALAHGYSKPNWLAFARRYGDWLVNNQNADGSFYRAYDQNGNPASLSKFNTTVPIRYLARLYEVTGDAKYKTAALAAGEMSRTVLFPFGTYVGGTADYLHQVIYDKEAGAIALYGYLALLDITQDPKWLTAAKSAADYTETWTYAYPFRVKPYVPTDPNAQDPGSTNPFNPNPAYHYTSDLVGLSLVKTGLSYVDVYSAYLSEPFYRLYLFTNDPHYLQQAKLYQNNANQISDWLGKNGLAQKGLVREGIGADYLEAAFNPYWLPWVSVAQTDPLSKLEDRFGSMDIDTIEQLPLSVRQQLNQ